MSRRPLILAAGALALMVSASVPVEAQSTTRSRTRTTTTRPATRTTLPPRADDAVLTANPYLGAPISSADARVNPYSPYGARNPYTTDGGRIYAPDGTYLGRLNANRYDPESVANPYGQYGSQYSPTSINNPYSSYGSPYATQSATNPYTTTPPRVVYPSASPYPASPSTTTGRTTTPYTSPYTNPYTTPYTMPTPVTPSAWP